MNVVEILKKLISYKSITPSDAGSFDFIKDFLSDFEAIEINKEGVNNLFLYKDFSPHDEKGIHVSFAGHLDVVPPGEGWETDPFEPCEKDGNIFGRGAQDMKSGVAAFLSALKQVKTFPGRLSLILTSDEEGDAKYGTVEVLKFLKERGELPDYCIVAEPTCEEQFGDMVKVGRRGSINGVIEKRGKQGHAAYPEKSKNPIHKVAQVLPFMAGIDLDDGDEFFAPSKFVITDIRAGMEVTNVTPGNLKMMFNVRNSTKTSKDDVEAFVHKYFKEMDYTLTLSQSAKPFLTDKDSAVVHHIVKAIEETTGVYPKLGTAGGTSDARFLGEYGVDTVEFGVINDTIHAPNERTSIKELEQLEKVFTRLLEKF